MKHHPHHGPNAPEPPPPDPLDAADEALARARASCAQFEYADDFEEITARHEITVNLNGVGSQPDLGRADGTGPHAALRPSAEYTAMPAVPMQANRAGLYGLVGTLVMAALGVAHALGWI